MFFDDGYFREETREGFVIAEDMKRAWAAQLEVLEEVKRVCGILGIKFFADWGTLLGAVRHHGFIHSIILSSSVRLYILREHRTYHLHWRERISLRLLMLE